MASVKKEPDVYSLYNWLSHLGLWRGAYLSNASETERKKALRQNKQKEWIITGSGNDADGSTLGKIISSTKWNPKTGFLEDKLVYWRHMPTQNDQENYEEDMELLSIRAVRDPDVNVNPNPNDPNPILIPDQIWMGGKPVFIGTLNGGSQSPRRPEYQRMIAGIKEISKRVKEKLDNGEPIADIGKVFAGGNLPYNMSEKLGGMPLIQGISPKGGWDKFVVELYDYFNEAALPKDHKPSFKLRPLDGLSAEDRLKALHGFRQNTLSPAETLQSPWGETSTDLQSRVTYQGETSFIHDKKKDRYIFTVSTKPVYTTSDMDISEPLEIARLEYSKQGEDRFTLEDANFMEGSSHVFTNWRDATNLIGFVQDCNEDFANNTYPKFRDHLTQHRLTHHIQELSPPPSLEDDGGEFLMIPVNGTSMEKKVDVFGDGIGGGIVFMHRGKKKNGEISEVFAIHDFPLAIGGPNSDFDGANPDFDPFMEGKQGVIVLSHDHFDHASLEYYAKQGKLKGQKIICSPGVEKIVRTRLDKLEVGKDHYPQFINYDHPDMIDMGDGQYSYCVRDEDGNERIWIQICENGSQHSAQVDSHMFTGTYKNRVFSDTYYLENDSYTTNERGWRFAERGQLRLADHENKTGVSMKALKARRMSYNTRKAEYQDAVKQEKVLEVAKVQLEQTSDKDKAGKIKEIEQTYKALLKNFTWEDTNEERLYISLEETTGLTSDGYCPKPDEFKETFRECMSVMPKDQAAIAFPFSTNSAEIRAMREIWSEPETLRHTTSVGANAEIRDSVMNQIGVDPDLDLLNIDIPADRIPEKYYDIAMKAINNFIFSREMNFGHKDYPYQVFKYIYDQAQKEIKAGNKCPDIINKYFFNGDPGAFDEVAEILGLDPPSNIPRRMPKVVNQALEHEKKRWDKALTKEGVSYRERKRLTDYYILRSLVNHNKVTFKSKNNWNDKNMYDAIIRAQPEASAYASRTSDEGKSFRHDMGKLGIISTGPTGTAEEQFATLSRYARGESLFDYDQEVRNTAYQIDPAKAVLFVTQPPSMGDDSRKAQDQLIQDVIENRGNTIFCAFRNGFRIHNPKQNRSRYENHFRKLGWKVEWHGEGKSGYLIVKDRPMHIHGHRFYQDMLDKHKDPRFKAKLVECIHNPGPKNLAALREIVQRTGRKLSVKDPDDHRAYYLRQNIHTKEPELAIKNYLTPSYWLIRLRRKFGQQYGGVLQMVNAVVMNRFGNKRSDGLDPRTDGDGYFEKRTSSILYNDFIKAENKPSARRRVIRPSTTNIQKSGGRPRGPMPGVMLG